MYYSRDLERGNDMLVCRCPDYDTPKCSRCVHSNTHLGDVPPMPSDSYEEVYKAGVIEGALQYGGMIIRPEDIEVPPVSGR